MDCCKTVGKVKLIRQAICTVSLHDRAPCCGGMRVSFTRLSIPVATGLCWRCADSRLGTGVIARKCARELHATLARRHARVVRTAVVRLDR
jgi:hypothetical protein